MEKETWLEEEIRIDPGKILRALWKNLWWQGLVCFLCGLIAWGIFQILPPEYESGVIFYVKNNTENSNGISSADIAASKELVESYMVILEAGETLEEVMQFAQSHRTRGEIREMLTASAVNSTEFFQVVVTAASAEEAQCLADAIAYVLPRRIAGILEGTSAKIVDTAVSEAQRDPMQQIIFVVGGMLAGLFLSASMIVVGTVLDKTICTEKDVIHFSGLPVLATVSSRDTYASESVRILRAKLRHLFGAAKDCRVIAIAAVAENSSQTAMNLAAAMAQTGARVALVLWDPRKNTQSSRCLNRNHPGVVDYLSGKAEVADILQPCSLDAGKIALSVISAGMVRGSSADLWGSSGAAVLFSQLRELFDVIVLELPPAEHGSALLEAVEYSDGLLLQVHQNRCDGNRLKVLLEELAFVEAPVLGVVFCSAAMEKKKRKKHRYER